MLLPRSVLWSIFDLASKYAENKKGNDEWTCWKMRRVRTRNGRSKLFARIVPTRVVRVNAFQKVTYSSSEGVFFEVLTFQVSIWSNSVCVYLCEVWLCCDKKRKIDFNANGFYVLFNQLWFVDEFLKWYQKSWSVNNSLECFPCVYKMM